MMISPETLRRFSLFAGLAPEMFKDLAMLGNEVSLKTGEWLFREGDEADSLYLVISGSIDLKIALDSSGERQEDLETIVAGEAIGWSTFVEPYQYTLSAVAAADVELVKLDGKNLRNLMTQNPEIGYNLMCHVAQAIAKRLNDLRVRFVSIAGD
jgi:CRP/FNR family cyclic AMP-dependent transcriptional regulator